MVGGADNLTIAIYCNIVGYRVYYIVKIQTLPHRCNCANEKMKMDDEINVNLDKLREFGPLWGSILLHLSLPHLHLGPRFA